MHTQKLLIGVTGAIGTLTFPSYLHALREKFSNIKIIMTETAGKFISAESISLIVKDVQNSLFPAAGEMTHVQIAGWADLFIVLPASAHTIAKAAHGLGDNLLTLSILAHSSSILFFPNMNKFMWEHPATQKNIALLKEYGHLIISPIERISYEHHSGDRNSGKHLPPPQEVVAFLESEVERRGHRIENRSDAAALKT